MKKFISILLVLGFIQMAGYAQNCGCDDEHPVKTAAKETPKPAAKPVAPAPVKIVNSWETLQKYMQKYTEERIAQEVLKIEAPKPRDWDWHRFFVSFFVSYRIIFIVLFVYNAIEVMIKWKEFRRHKLEEFGFHWYSMAAWAAFIMSWWY